MSRRPLKLAGGGGALGPWGRAQEGIADALALDGVPAEFLAHDSALSFMNNMDALEAAMASGERGQEPVDEASLLSVDRGVADISCNFREQVDWAYRGIGCHQRYPHRNLRAIAHLVQPQYVGIAATEASGITSLEQVAAERRPLRLVTVSKQSTSHQTRMMGYVTSRIFELCGFTQLDVVAWGGTVLGNRDAIPAVRDGAVDLLAMPAYSGWGPAWGQVWLEAHIRLDLRFLPVPEPVRVTMAAELGLRPGDLPAGLFRGVDEPVPTFVLRDHVVHTHADLPDDDAYAVARAIADHSACLLTRAVTHAYDPRTAATDTAIPLHPGARAFYAERGWLPEGDA